MNDLDQRETSLPRHVIAAVIPCYRAEGSIDDVIAAMPEDVSHIVCVDDCSDDDTFAVLQTLAEEDDRLHVVQNEVNQGVGGAMVTGYRAAINLGADVLVKLDSDGQMDPGHIPKLVAPILEGEADYTKGNRFFDLESVSEMPAVRLLGNIGLSFMTKAATGYWGLFDPTNGFTAIHARVAGSIPLGKLHKRYFFESDVLFRLSTIRAKVVEVPMAAFYGDETSNLSVTKTLVTFPVLHGRNFLKRLVYNYFLRGFSAASLCLLFGLPILLFGLIFGFSTWAESAQTGIAATAGTVMLSAMPILVGIQLLLTFLVIDVSAAPTRAIHRRIDRIEVLKPAARATEAPNPPTDVRKVG